MDTSIDPCAKQSTGMFLEKLFDMLSNTNFIDAISWNEHRTGFTIKNADLLASLLPVYFKTDKVESLKRQLNYYEFQLIDNTYMHPLFSADNPENRKRMVRKYTAKKGENTKKRSESTTERWEFSLLDNETWVPRRATLVSASKIAELMNAFDENICNDDNMYQKRQRRF